MGLPGDRNCRPARATTLSVVAAAREKAGGGADNRRPLANQAPLGEWSHRTSGRVVGRASSSASARCCRRSDMVPWSSLPITPARGDGVSGDRQGRLRVAMFPLLLHSRSWSSGALVLTSSRASYMNPPRILAVRGPRRQLRRPVHPVCQGARSSSRPKSKRRVYRPLRRPVPPAVRAVLVPNPASSLLRGGGRARRLARSSRATRRGEGVFDEVWGWGSSLPVSARTRNVGLVGLKFNK